MTTSGDRHPLSARFHEILREHGEMHDRKQADYGKADDPFANVRSSDEFGVTGWVGAMIRLNDKVKRLQSFCRTRGLRTVCGTSPCTRRSRCACGKRAGRTIRGLLCVASTGNQHDRRPVCLTVLR
jgi:hypothetical protein